MLTNYPADPAAVFHMTVAVTMAVIMTRVVALVMIVTVPGAFMPGRR